MREKPKNKLTVDEMKLISTKSLGVKNKMALRTRLTAIIHIADLLLK